MKIVEHVPSRRQFLRGAAISAAGLSLPSFFHVPGAFAEALQLTPPQTEGPFYPDRLPLDTDNDLLIINDGITPAVGEITHLSGRVLDAAGNPLRSALVEIWKMKATRRIVHRSVRRIGRTIESGMLRAFWRLMISRRPVLSTSIVAAMTTAIMRIRRPSTPHTWASKTL